VVALLVVWVLDEAGCFETREGEEVGGVLLEFCLGGVVVELKEFGYGEGGWEILEVQGQVLDVESVYKMLGHGSLGEGGDFVDLGRGQV